jgi:hypothetical protein
MIDDLMVPGDDGYGYDTYGKQGALTIDTLVSALKRHQLMAFFPAAPSHTETGHRRGCVVLCRRGELSGKLSAMADLKAASTAK